MLQALNAGPLTAHIPVAVVTDLSETNEEKLLKGAAAFVGKGSFLNNDESLLSTIKETLEGHAA
jgi:hypothetical protein